MAHFYISVYTVKQMVASLKMLPDGKKVLARLNEGLAMNKEDFEARWTAD